MANLNKIIYLTEAQKNILFTEGSITSNGRTITYNDNDIYLTPETIDSIPTSGSSNMISSGAVYAALQSFGSPVVETISSTTPVINGISNHQYICGEVSTISITPPVTGCIDVIFESGTTPAVLTAPNSVKWPSWFDASSLDANCTYEINILNGIYGVVSTWA